MEEESGAYKILLDRSMYELFRQELDAETHLISEGLLKIEREKRVDKTIDSLMRATHSIKGAARVIQLEPIVQLAHAFEDGLTAIKKEELPISEGYIDILLKGVDILLELGKVPLEEVKEWCLKNLLISEFIKEVRSFPNKEIVTPYTPKQLIHQPELTSIQEERTLKVSSKRLNRLMGIAGEMAIESLWLQPFEKGLINIKNKLSTHSQTTKRLREALKETNLNEKAEERLTELQKEETIYREGLESSIADFEMFIRRHSSLSERLWGEIIDIRMRPLADGVKTFPRFVRDLSHELGKKAHLEISGEAIPVDRDILEKLEAPLLHLLRNAIDHGIEPPETRIKMGKAAEGMIKLESTQQAGMLFIKVTDDGQGIDVQSLREKIVRENLITAEVAKNLTTAEILDFLLLPGFTTASKVTEISGRGVGLNVVQTMLQTVGGTLRITSEKERYTTFTLQLPLTLSLIRSLLVEIGGEPYAFPLSRIDRALLMKKSEIKTCENKNYFHYEGKNIGLLFGNDLFEFPEENVDKETISIIILSDRTASYALAVDKFIGEKDLVVQEIDPLLGKIPGISSGAFMEDGSPLLIIDVEDLIRLIDQNLLQSSQGINNPEDREKKSIRKKRILVVDDSITVREVECRLLEAYGYEVHSAINGIDGCNALRMGNYDLVITDVDMPRMNGLEFVKMIKAEENLKKIPVIMVSYKDRSEDRKSGLEAGADHYLTKSSFHDETLLKAVIELIGNGK